MFFEGFLDEKRHPVEYLAPVFLNTSSLGGPVAPHWLSSVILQSVPFTGWLGPLAPFQRSSACLKGSQ